MDYEIRHRAQSPAKRLGDEEGARREKAASMYEYDRFGTDHPRDVATRIPREGLGRLGCILSYSALRGSLSEEVSRDDIGTDQLIA